MPALCGLAFNFVTKTNVHTWITTTASCYYNQLFIKTFTRAGAFRLRVCLSAQVHFWSVFLKACENQGTLHADLCLCSTGCWSLPQGCQSNLTFGISSILSVALCKRSLQLSPNMLPLLTLSKSWGSEHRMENWASQSCLQDWWIPSANRAELKELKPLTPSFLYTLNYHLKNRGLNLFAVRQSGPLKVQVKLIYWCIWSLTSLASISAFPAKQN